MQPYYRDSTELIKELLQSTYGKDFHAYIEGDPLDIPESLLPCIVISLQHSTSNPGPTGTQEINQDILIQVILDKKQDFGAAKSYPLVDMTNRRLRLLVEGRDPVNAQYQAKTICGILAKNITVGAGVLQLKMQTSYPLAERANGMLTQEAHVMVSLRERIIVPQRQ